MELAVMVSIMIAAFSVAVSFLAIRRMKRQIAEMTEALADVRDGNGNRRMLAAAGDLAAPLAYEINEIVISYEDQLAAYRQTKEANDRLMTSLSHDVRTPLTTLIGYLDAVQKGIAEGAQREEYIGRARRKAYDLKEYIDVLFDWFRLHSDEFVLHIVPVEAGELTRDILIGWIPVLEEERIEYIVEIPEQPFSVNLDPDAYARILNNLIQNAVSHSHADRITVKLSEQGGKVRVCVADNGTGMTREDIEHIFERLYKCDKGRSAKGSGLGLSIVRQLTEKMDGTIRVESAPGKGTVFTLLFLQSS